MKKIALVIAGLARPGGAEKVVADLSHEFQRRHYHVTIITFANLPAEIPTYPVSGRIIHVDVPPRPGNILVQLLALYQRSRAFRKLFRQEQFDHIYSFLEAANVPCAMASGKVVLSIHLDPNTMTRGEWFAFRWLYPRARRVVAVSRQMQVLLEHKARLSNVLCIHNPIDTEYIRQQARSALLLSEPFIIAVGRLEPQKRFDLLLEAFANSQARHGCKLIILGSGSLQQSLTEQIQQQGLQHQAILAGFETNPYRYMARALFQVMSSDYEGYPLVLIEALSLGCPVVSTDCPTGPREIIRHRQNGLLVKKGDSKALTAGIDQLFSHPELRQAIKTRAPASVAQNHIKQVADAWLSA